MDGYGLYSTLYVTYSTSRPRQAVTRDSKSRDGKSRDVKISKLLEHMEHTRHNIITQPQVLFDVRTGHHVMLKPHTP